ncbi:MAG: c-type cytochrome [Dinoroseobacter sp.]|nr:c-type cytochrome [Dinoroseobacter sp.]
MRRLVTGALALSVICGAAAAQEAGKQEYMVACAGCHGESGMGQGPFSEWLNLDVPSLTGLSAANDGVFPYLDVFMVVDGRSGVRGHGGAMPIWGERFSTTAREEFGYFGAEVVTRGRIAVLVDYIESIQE